jgi:hypothetical protein
MRQCYEHQRIPKHNQERTLAMSNGIVPVCFSDSPLPESKEILYEEIVALGGGRYLGFVKETNGQDDVILFDVVGIRPIAIPAKEISADKVRSTLAKVTR